MTAITSGGAIPEVFDYRVLLEPEGVFIGTLNEDFAIESLPGDIFQLGNTSWRILRMGSGVVRVADAQGQPPSMPFWLGEAPARSDEVSAASRACGPGPTRGCPGPRSPRTGRRDSTPLVEWLARDYDLPRSAAEQIAAYLAEGKRALGAIPSAETLIVERFFDESGGMQLVLHAPFGSRVNRAWGLALRKKFCQSFNFELQAAATDEGIILSLGSSHSFPLEDVFRYLHPNTVRETLVQAVLDSPIFETRWRWTTTLALAVPRNRNGARIPAQLQRMYAEDLLQGVFPDAAACLDNIAGRARGPGPSARQPGAARLAWRRRWTCRGSSRCSSACTAARSTCLARETPEPSVFSHELLNSAVYTFLDDAPLEERRTQAVYTRRATEPRRRRRPGRARSGGDRARARGSLAGSDTARRAARCAAAGGLRAPRRSVRAPGAGGLAALACRAGRGGARVRRERLLGRRRALRGAERGRCRRRRAPVIPERLRKSWTREDAARELVRGRMEVLGPVTARRAGRIRSGSTRRRSWTARCSRWKPRDAYCVDGSRPRAVTPSPDPDPRSRLGER